MAKKKKKAAPAPAAPAPVAFNWPPSGWADKLLSSEISSPEISSPEISPPETEIPPLPETTLPETALPETALLEGPPFRTTDLNNSSAPSSSPSINVDTPTDTTIRDDSTDHIHSSTSQKADSMETPPYAGPTFAIRERKSGRLITLIDGKLRLEDCTGDQGGWHWKCEEKAGWFGFRNLVSGTYIGHDTKGHLWANYSHHEPHVYFCARRHPHGGYLLLIRQGDELHKVTLLDGSVMKGALILTTGEGMLWDFEKISDGGKLGSS